ncbi:aspartate aminotransferase family protein [Eubacterium sp. TM06-47]|nr:aspartate aminotransferase family protein [Eubacterium sp. TM06-47]
MNRRKVMEESIYLMHTYNRFNIEMESGQGCYLKDTNGKEYLDLTSGIGVNCLGHNHPVLVDAIQKQVATLMECSNLYYSKPMVDAAKKLVEYTGLSKVFFSNSGAEANEGMIKLARKYSYDKYGAGRDVIITLKQSFHGRTITTLKATGQDKFHQYYFPFTEGFDYAAANDIEDLKKVANEKTCAVMVELIQGESGVVPLDKEYVKAVEEFCHSKDILILVDEVQTGIGHTGTLFCFEQYNVLPDIVTTAKALGGGVPIGAVITGDKCKDTFGPGDHGSTFGGNPLSCKAADTVLSIVTEHGFLDHVKVVGAALKTGIENIHSDKIKEVRGIGLMLGIVVDPDKRADYVQAMMDKGLLTLTAGKDAIRLLPPLTLSLKEVDEALSIMKEVFE